MRRGCEALSCIFPRFTARTRTFHTGVCPTETISTAWKSLLWKKCRWAVIVGAFFLYLQSASALRRDGLEGSTPNLTSAHKFGTCFLATSPLVVPPSGMTVCKMCSYAKPRIPKFLSAVIQLLCSSNSLRKQSIRSTTAAGLDCHTSTLQQCFFLI